MTLKEQLTLAHRIIAHLKMDDLTYTHLSILQKDGTFALSPFGIQFKSVIPQDILEFKLTGEMLKEQKADYYYDHLSWIFGKKIIESIFAVQLEKPRKYNPTGFAIHSSIYKARKDAGAIIHLHTKESIAVSVNKKGLLPISQHAMHFYNAVSYHSYNSLVLTPEEEAQKLVEDLGKNNVMFLQNHGFITVGKTIEEAIFYAYHLQKACEVQVLCKEDEVIIPPHEVCKKARNDLLSFEENLGERDFKSFQIGNKFNINKR